MNSPDQVTKQAEQFVSDSLNGNEIKLQQRDFNINSATFVKDNFNFHLANISLKNGSLVAELTSFKDAVRVFSDTLNFSRASQRKKFYCKNYPGNMDNDIIEIKNKLLIILADEALALKSDSQSANESILSKYPNMVILGELDELTAIYSIDTRKTRYIKLKDLSIVDIVSLANISIFSDDLRRLQTAIAFEARKNQIGQMKSQGQGIWLEKDKSLFIVSGNNAYIWKNGKIKETIDKPIHNKKRILFQGDKDWFQPDNINRKTDYQESFINLYKILGQWNWGSIGGNFKLGIFTALLFAYPFQYLWDWRPHIYLTGRRAVGKSTLVQFVFDDLFSKLGLRMEGDTSEAAFRQSVSNNLYCTCIDEFEKVATKSRNAILKLLRISNRKVGTIRKGTPSGKEQLFEMSHIVTLVSIEVPLKDAADKSRFIQFDISLYRSKVLKLPGSEEIQQLFNNIISAGLHNYQKYLDKRLEIIHNYEGDLDSRILEGYAVPLSIISVLTGKDPYDYLKKIEAVSSVIIQEDDERLIETIINTRITIRDGAPQDTTVGELISSIVNTTDSTLQQNLNSRLQIYGLSINKTKENIAIHPTSLSRNILKSTDFEYFGIKDILLRVEGASEQITKFSGKTQRCISIPIEKIISIEKTPQKQFDF